jgi:hypothetical protein
VWSTSQGPDAACDVPAGWYVDPYGRFELRYHNGTAWTADVSVVGDRFVDPMGTTPAPDDSAPNPRATASMVLGIVAIGIGWFPYVAVAGVICALLAIGLGLAARRRGGGPGSTGSNRARVGITTGVVGLVVAMIGLAFTVIVARAIDRYTNPEPNEAIVTSCVTDGEGMVSVAGELTNLGAADADFTVRVAVMRAGTDNVHRTVSIELDDVEPTATVAFETTVQVALADVECTVHDVDGPLPFGLDIPT